MGTNERERSWTEIDEVLIIRGQWLGFPVKVRRLDMLAMFTNGYLPVELANAYAARPADPGEGADDDPVMLREEENPDAFRNVVRFQKELAAYACVMPRIVLDRERTPEGVTYPDNCPPWEKRLRPLEPAEISETDALTIGLVQYVYSLVVSGVARGQADSLGTFPVDGSGTVGAADSGGNGGTVRPASISNA